jgi:hypothetical protein
MAHGGKRKGSGRKPGKLPKLRDHFEPQEIKAFVADLKIAAEKSERIKIFLAEQLFGKAYQPVGGDDDAPPIKLSITSQLSKVYG